MKPCYTIAELEKILQMPIYNIAAGLLSSGVIPYINHKPADLSQWANLGPTPVYGVNFTFSKHPVPDPTRVVVDLKVLPQHWQDSISSEEQKRLLVTTDNLANQTRQEEAIETAKDNDKPLHTRERNTLLVIIAALAKDAKIDLSTPSKTSLLIEKMTDDLGAHVDHSTIESKIKLIHDAVASRTK